MVRVEAGLGDGEPIEADDDRIGIEVRLPCRRQVPGEHLDVIGRGGWLVRLGRLC
jgi:hypothetical protein